MTIESSGVALMKRGCGTKESGTQEIRRKAKDGGGWDPEFVSSRFRMWKAGKQEREVW
jgi:hypothetical protein